MNGSRTPGPMLAILAAMAGDEARAEVCFSAEQAMSVACFTEKLIGSALPGLGLGRMVEFDEYGRVLADYDPSLGDDRPMVRMGYNFWIEPGPRPAVDRARNRADRCGPRPDP